MRKRPQSILCILMLIICMVGVLSQYPPTGKFKWMTEKEIEKINSANQVKDSDKILILEVDLEYPNELHEMHNDYPLTEERRTMENICKGVDLKLVTDE